MLKSPMTLDQELAAEAEGYRSELAACRAQLQAAQAWPLKPGGETWWKPGKSTIEFNDFPWKPFVIILDLYPFIIYRFTGYFPASHVWLPEGTVFWGTSATHIMLSFLLTPESRGFTVWTVCIMDRIYHLQSKNKLGQLFYKYIIWATAFIWLNGEKYCGVP